QMRETLDRNFPDQSHSPTCTCQSFSKSSRNTLVKWIHFLRHERVIAREQQVARGRKHRTSHGPHEELSCIGAVQRWRIRDDLQTIACQRLRQAEVANLNIPGSDNLHIRRLEISDAVGERFALNQLEYEIGITVGFLQVVDAGNIRVIQ